MIGAFDLGSVRLTREAILPNAIVLYGSSNPGNLSFGRFSRPLLKDYNVHQTLRIIAFVEVV